MAPRIFISYRTSDGADKATALARDLGQVFGHDQVFLDKDDLRGGSRWAQEVSRTLRARPALLLLMTPDLLGAADAATGHRRIDDPADPVRREVAAALEHGAELIPVLCDGVDALPAGDGLPPPFDHLAERTWRRLRAYDWAADVQRLVADLRGLGLKPAPARRRRLLAGATLGVAGAAFGGWRWSADREAGLSGRWLASLGPDQVPVRLRQQGDALTLVSEPIDIRQRADWSEYRDFWLQRFGEPLDAVRYRGQGTVRREPGSAWAVDLAIEIGPAAGDAVIDNGNLSLTQASDDRLVGRRWLNSVQAETPATLVRRR
jgi:hypothetical protein